MRTDKLFIYGEKLTWLGVRPYRRKREKFNYGSLWFGIA